MANVIKVDVTYNGNNYGCAWSDETGTVVVIAETFDKLKTEFVDSLRFHVEGCLEDGDSVPEYLVNGDYEIVFNLR